MSKDPVLEIHSGLILKGQLSMAKDVLLTGNFEGDLQTLGRLTVAAGGKAHGSIEAGALTLEPGHQVEGRIKVKPTAPGAFVEKKKPTVGKWSSAWQKLKQLAFGRKAA